MKEEYHIKFIRKINVLKNYKYIGGLVWCCYSKTTFKKEWMEYRRGVHKRYKSYSFRLSPP